MSILITSLAVATLAAAVVEASPSKGVSVMKTSSTSQTTQQSHPYIGMWVTGDGRIRQELLPDGRYDEARGARKSAYQGRYEVNGNRIEYWDDTGFTADGEFRDDVLYHGGMVFYRER
ncbi:hypothetical protein G6L28_03190 [Agrobacterium larrymoorei]|uniref:Atu4866 domain-containing protein n=1 Tax=Agrobacterium larrymoorei TaxID=160699 RepID=UPI001574717A|nr:Atu4866 domain-containing protein [Agrobacterium larrymoorei]NTJ41603.1 hypothetical protein [Agrobacterium larrymoorei]